MHANFYQKYQKIVYKNICGMIKAFLKYWNLLRALNRTSITLIPKVVLLKRFLTIDQLVNVTCLINLFPTY